MRDDSSCSWNRVDFYSRLIHRCDEAPLNCFLIRPYTDASRMRQRCAAALPMHCVVRSLQGSHAWP